MTKETDTTTPAILAATTRRALFSAAPSVALIGGALALSAAAVRPNALQQRLWELVELIRPELPPETTHVHIDVGYDLSGGDGPHIGARAMRRVWQTDKRLINGGLLVDHCLGQWWPAHGFLKWTV